MSNNNEYDDYVEDENKRTNIVGMSLLIMFFSIAALMFMLFCLSGCTLSFQNVMTSGTASDVVDSDPSTDTTANPTLQFPIDGV